MNNDELITLAELAAEFNRRYPPKEWKGGMKSRYEDTRVLQRACKRAGIPIYKKKTASSVGGRPTLAIMPDDKPRLEEEIESRLPARRGQEVLHRLMATMTGAEIARRTDINSGTISLVANGHETFTRAQVELLKELEREL